MEKTLARTTDNMFYVPFHEYFPDIAERETRSVTIPPGAKTGLPAGEYGFTESYCSKPGCDCRRVFLGVFSESRKRLEAVIAWGWEDLEFYRAWMGIPELFSVKNLKGPILNPGSPATELAPALLELTRHVLLRDREYIERIKRHYRLFKDKIDESAAGKSRSRKGREGETSRAKSFAQGTVPSSGLQAFLPREYKGDEISAFAEKYLDVLQNLEFGIVKTYKRRAMMTDYDVMRIIGALVDGYQAEKIGRPPRYAPATEVEQELMDSVRGMCEWRLGRLSLSNDERLEGQEQPDPVSVDEIVACLKKILNSVKKWNKSGGRQGYLDFVIQHIR